MPTAYSYLRFSSPAQANGDSIRRQTALRQKWLYEHPEVTLDTTLRMTDAGRSGYKRTDAETYAISQFVEQIKAGKVAAGSYLLLENLDRLSREETGTATELFLSIANRGVIIVQLSPVVCEFRKPVDLLVLMRAALELSRGNSESKMKSARSEANWSAKQKQAAEKQIVTRKLPGWISAVGGIGKQLKHTAPGEVQFALNEHANTVRRIFDLSLAGHGAATIARKLNTENVPVMGRKVVSGRVSGWGASVVRHVLATPAVIGQYVPYAKRAGNTKTQGMAVEGYFPAVVDEAIYHAARAVTERRGVVGRGRKGRHVNLFGGMLRDARTGGTMGYIARPQGPSLCATDPLLGRSADRSAPSFPAGVFETAILSQLREVSAAELMETNTDTPVVTLTAQLADVNAGIKAWESKMDDLAITEIVAKKLGELSTKRKALTEQIEQAQREAASPLSAAWGDFRSLADVLATDNSDANRRKVQTALRRTIDRVTVLIVNENRAHQNAVVAVKFASAHTRLYLLEKKRHQPVKVASVAMSDLKHDLGTPEGVVFFTKHIKSWGEDGWMQPGVGTAVN